MSTKAIREALDAASDMSDHPNAPIGLLGLLVRAVGEVMAIERAAKALSHSPLVPRSETDRDDARAAMGLLNRIAKEAP